MIIPLEIGSIEQRKNKKAAYFYTERFNAMASNVSCALYGGVLSYRLWNDGSTHCSNRLRCQRYDKGRFSNETNKKWYETAHAKWKNVSKRIEEKLR